MFPNSFALPDNQTDNRSVCAWCVCVCVCARGVCVCVCACVVCVCAHISMQCNTMGSCQCVLAKGIRQIRCIELPISMRSVGGPANQSARIIVYCITLRRYEPWW